MLFRVPKVKMGLTPSFNLPILTQQVVKLEDVKVVMPLPKLSDVVYIEDVIISLPKSLLLLI